MDDKLLVILCATILGLFAMYWIPSESPNIITAIISGMFGVAVGKGLNGSKTP